MLLRKSGQQTAKDVPRIAFDDRAILARLCILNHIRAESLAAQIE